MKISNNSGQPEKKRLKCLLDLNSNLSSQSDIAQLLDNILHYISEMIECQQAAFLCYDHKKKSAGIISVTGLDKEDIAEPQIVCTKDVHEWLFQGCEILSLTEEGGDEFLLILDTTVHFYKCFEIQVPVFVCKKLFGVLSLGSKVYGLEYSDEDIELLQIAVNFISLAIENLLLKGDNSTFVKKRPVMQKLIEDKNTRPSSPAKIRRKAVANEMLGKSSAILQVHEIIDQVAPKDVTVLITGESGTGKELVAREIHIKSSRRNKSLVTMNCAALPENLVESELFGHERGAFTSAYITKKGRFEIANNSTLFLDEIADMSLSTQAKLLRVLQDGEFQRVGGIQTIETDARIVAATNKELEDEIDKKNFREDLFYRLNVVRIALPPLRQRKEDIPILAEFFIENFNRFYHKKIQGLTNEALDRLFQYDFPGNIRELQNIIERAMIMEKGTIISPRFLPVFSAKTSRKNIDHTNNFSLENLQRKHIQEILSSVDYNKSHAAKILGIARKTLREKIAKYGIKVP